MEVDTFVKPDVYLASWLHSGISRVFSERTPTVFRQILFLIHKMFLFWLNILWFPSTLFTSLSNVRKAASLASTISRVTTLSHQHNMISGKVK